MMASSAALEFSGTGTRKDYQAAQCCPEQGLFRGKSCRWTVPADFTFADPVEVDGPDFVQLAAVLKTLNVTTTAITADVTT